MHHDRLESRSSVPRMASMQVRVNNCCREVLLRLLFLSWSMMELHGSQGGQQALVFSGKAKRQLFLDDQERGKSRESIPGVSRTGSCVQPLTTGSRGAVAGIEACTRKS